MCGIVGILGTGPVAGSIVAALKRLEYRGYDSAGVATLENGRLERRRAEGKLKNLEAKLAAAPLGGAIGHRPHPLGDARQADRDQRSSACFAEACGRPQRHHREFPDALL
jgi:glucosamine 6-phosphate synthetase-like amidotransferase/phosphosugar isomerase protein